GKQIKTDRKVLRWYLGAKNPAVDVRCTRHHAPVRDLYHPSAPATIWMIAFLIPLLLKGADICTICDRCHHGPLTLTPDLFFKL
ncbi:hypothetical protein DKP78_22460, partial [Enterococcus faecium]